MIFSCNSNSATYGNVEIYCNALKAYEYGTFKLLYSSFQVLQTVSPGLFRISKEGDKKKGKKQAKNSQPLFLCDLINLVCFLYPRKVSRSGNEINGTVIGVF